MVASPSNSPPSPLNPCAASNSTNTVTSPQGDKAFKDAAKYCNCKVIKSIISEKCTKIPTFDDLDRNLDAKYLNIGANETINGIEFKDYLIPKNPGEVLVANMPSYFWSKPVVISKFCLGTKECQPRRHHHRHRLQGPARLHAAGDDGLQDPCMLTTTTHSTNGINYVSPSFQVEV